MTAEPDRATLWRPSTLCSLGCTIACRHGRRLDQCGQHLAVTGGAAEDAMAGVMFRARAKPPVRAAATMSTRTFRSRSIGTTVCVPETQVKPFVEETSLRLLFH